MRYQMVAVNGLWVILIQFGTISGCTRKVPLRGTRGVLLLFSAIQAPAKLLALHRKAYRKEDHCRDLCPSLQRTSFSAHLHFPPFPRAA
ncbi:hypothetical protein BDZ94DRAFT_302593 [Collybia nuda]|uniref:Uncharacterized protein n=1 Tax=Collybia nuda TaxID=64659 RepID=A0A9P5Y8Z2_9AGAR|nr:hypothetical protein BDZ94DRAFT_302593 [Collybia nuda]